MLDNIWVYFKAVLPSVLVHKKVIIFFTFDYQTIRNNLSFIDEDTATEKRRDLGDSSTSAMGDFGGDYGDYLKLLESNSALGFNPQADPIGDNQVSLSARATADTESRNSR